MAQEAEVLLKAHHQKLKEAMLYTLEVAEKMPEAQYGYRPTPEEMSFGEQLLYLGDNLVWLSSNYLGEKPLSHRSKVEGQAINKAEVMLLLSESYGFALRELEELDAKSLTREFPWRAGVKKNPPRKKFLLTRLLWFFETFIFFKFRFRLLLWTDFHV